LDYLSELKLYYLRIFTYFESLCLGAIGSQFPSAYQGSNLAGTNLAPFRPVFTLPGQANIPQAAFPGTAPPQ